MSDNENLATQVEETTEVTNTEPQDIRDVIAGELDKLDAAPEVTEETTEQKEQRERDEKGRFAAKEAEKAEKPEEAPKEEATTEEKPRNPFSSWKKEAQEALSKLDPQVQKYIMDRESQFHNGIQQYKQDAIIGRQLNAAIQPHKEYLDYLKVTPEHAFDKLLQTEKLLRTGSDEQKSQMFLKMAHDYGINLAALQQMPFDPNAHRLESELAAMRNQLQSINQQKQIAEQEQLGQTIQGFAQSHEYFEEVRETMADLLDRGLANDLEDAYTKAVRLNDDVFNRTLAQQSQSNQTSQLQRADMAAKAAKAAAVSVKGAPTGVTRAPEPKSTEEAVRAAMAAMGF